ncbi:transcriptional regulator GcvA [Sphingomonas sp. LaA6.9]|uniref:transcriptional regulator GcvA n=1 Tax=Sphingomonas sp. LaA6.9 TaxID=2919914 RepID=UPI001F4F465D|nr:transcriptional regulator GcvA [Sphingomonas sp. LaA6.9]MCJ8158724.1 transcriptional regulator GcvA [Sphingomonas sp. LaA6.9]
MSRKLPPLLGLRVFECVARHLSFTKAADELCVTQAAVSHQIKALEDWLGAPLFQRLSRTIKLTDVGESLVGPLGRALDIMAQATSEALERDQVTPLTVATFDSFSAAWIIPRLSRFRERFPEIDIRFIAKRQEDDALSSGDADLEIRYGNGAWPNLQVERLMSESVLPVCSPELLERYGKPDSLADIARLPLLHDVFSVDWAEFLNHFGVRGINVRRGFGFSHSHLVKQACLAGHGIALGRWPLVVEEVQRGELVCPFEEKLMLDDAYYVVCRKSVSDEANVKAFAYWLLDEAELFVSQSAPLPT